MSLLNKRELRKFRENYISFDQTPVTEGLKLAVHFDEKDYVKRIGAQWQPDPSGKGGYWWMPTNTMHRAMPDDMEEIVNIFDDKIDPDATADGLSRLEWLNRNQMVEGTHGNLDEGAALAAIVDLDAVEFEVRNTSDDNYGHFYVFADVNVVNWTANGANPNYNRQLMTVEQSRDMWNALMEQGYRPVENSRKSS